MVVNKKVTGKASSLPAGIGIGVALGLMITLLGTAVVAWLVVTEIMREDMVGYGAMIILILASIGSSWLASQRTKRQRLQVCLITGGIYYLSLLSITALFFGGQYQGMGVTAILVFLGCGVTSLMGVKGKNGKKIKIRKRAYC